MEPVTVATKVGGWLAAKFGKKVVERWSRKRAESFFQEFVERVGQIEKDGTGFGSLEGLLEELLAGEKTSEVLFEAYRRVCLSASSSFGPRVIAYYTALLIVEERAATEEEERILMAAEVLSDSEFLQLLDYISHTEVLDGLIELHDESVDSNFSGSVAIGPINLGEFIGNWCLKLERCGLVVQDLVVSHLNYEADSEHHVDEPGVITKYVWKVRIANEINHLIGVLEKIVSASAVGVGEDLKE